MNNSELDYFWKLINGSGIKEEKEFFYSVYTETGLFTDITINKEELNVTYKKVNPKDSKDISENYETDYFINVFKDQLGQAVERFKNELFLILKEMTSNRSETLKLYSVEIDDLLSKAANKEDSQINQEIQSALEEVNRHVIKLIKVISNDANPINANIEENLIKEFAEIFSEKTKYPAEIIREYLIRYKKSMGTGSERAKAKNVFGSQNIPSDSTLSNWEKKYASFVKARTENDAEK